MTDEKPLAVPSELRTQPEKPKPVMQEEFSAFKKEVNDGIGAIMGKLEVLAKAPVSAPVVSAPVKVEAGPDNETPVPVSWVNAVHEILGPEFDVKFEQPDSGGALFTIIVPKDKSNATVDHWKMYKRDFRTREIGATGLGGVKEWALLVRKNLTASGTKLIQYP
jgi:hypothetical protein